MSLALFSAAAGVASAAARSLARELSAASRQRAATTAAEVQRAIERKQAPGLIKALQKELKTK